MATKEEIERSMEKICSKFTKQLQTSMTKKFDELCEDIATFKQNLDSISGRVDDNKKSIEDLQDKVAYLEQEKKKNSLRFHGISETNEEDTAKVIVDFINHQLKLQCSPADINYSFRVGDKKSSNRDTNHTPRPVVVDFIRNQKKSEILSARKNLKGSAYVIFEDLTSARYSLLMEAKKLFGKNAWSTGGRIFIWCTTSNTKVEVKSLQDLK